MCFCLLDKSGKGTVSLGRGTDSPLVFCVLEMDLL